MGVRGYERIISSIRLGVESTKLDIPGACVGVCTKALGGDVDLTDITPMEEGNLFAADIVNFAPAKGIDLGSWYEIPYGIDVDILRSYLKDKGFEEGNNNKTFVGHFIVCLKDSENEMDPSNHCLAIPERDQLPRDARRTFKKNDSWLIVDTTTNAGCFISTTSILALTIDEIIKSGMTVQISKAYLRK